MTPDPFRLRPSRTLVVIPAYNECKMISDVVKGLRQAGYDVAVVDDGSTDGTAASASLAGAVVLRHAVNRGQGAALQTGLTYAVRSGVDFVVTFDADGQHSPSDVPALLAPLKDGTAEVALGSRFLGSTSGLPWFRALLLKCGVVFTRSITGLELTDAHNGLRALTSTAASRINLTLDRMAHASEILDQVAATGLPYVEVPVSVEYSSYSLAKGQRSSDAIGVLVDYLLHRLLGV